MFLGRQDILLKLNNLLEKNTSSLVILKGRRRVGKSTLIQQFAKKFTRFYEFQGLPPHKAPSLEKQLNHFGDMIAPLLGLSSCSPKNWSECFKIVEKLVNGKKSTLLFLDEISWMARGDADFAGKLKIAWDTLWKQNPKLVVVICGSVSAWIQKNILDNTGFVGRISLDLTLEELELHYCSQFLNKKPHDMTVFDQFKILSCVGGIPRYLEEVIPKFGAEKNIKNLFFESSGLLFNEFEHIFSEVFEKRTTTLKDIVLSIASSNLSSVEIAKTLQKDQGGDLTESLKILELSGFIERDYTWNSNGKNSKLSEYRIKDNFLRFYLKYVLPNEEAIKRRTFVFQSLDQMIHWNSIAGLQFENLMLSNKLTIAKMLQIDFSHILQIGRYFQSKTKLQVGCQIDLLIQTKFNIFYVVEIKFRKRIGIEVISEVQKKIEALKKPKFASVQPILLYMGELDEQIYQEDYFAFIIDAAKLLID